MCPINGMEFNTVTLQDSHAKYLNSLWESLINSSKSINCTFDAFGCVKNGKNVDVLVNLSQIEKK